MRKGRRKHRLPPSGESHYLSYYYHHKLEVRLHARNAAKQRLRGHEQRDRALTVVDDTETRVSMAGKARLTRKGKVPSIGLVRITGTLLHFGEWSGEPTLCYDSPFEWDRHVG